MSPWMLVALPWVCSDLPTLHWCCLIYTQLYMVSAPVWLSVGSAEATVDNISWLNVAHAWLPSVGFRSWSRFLAVSLQVTWVINPAVGGRYFPPGRQLPSQPLRGLLPVLLLGEQRHDVTLQHRSCDLNLNPTMPKSSTLTTHSRRPPTELAQLGSPELRAIKTGVC